MGHLSAAKTQRDFDLVAFFEKSANGAHFHVVIVIVDARTHLDFFELNDLLIFASFGGFLLLLKFELAEVEDLAHRRLSVRRDLYEVEPDLFGAGECVKLGNHSDVLTRLVDQADFAGADLVINFGAGRFPALWLGAHRFADDAFSFNRFNVVGVLWQPNRTSESRATCELAEDVDQLAAKSSVWRCYNAARALIFAYCGAVNALVAKPIG